MCHIHIRIPTSVELDQQHHHAPTMMHEWTDAFSLTDHASLTVLMPLYRLSPPDSSACSIELDSR